MPFHRYACEECGYEFRFLHLDRVDDDVTCPKCESKDVQRLLPRVAVQFKGSGYYKTDRAGKKSKVRTKGQSDKDASSEASLTESRDSKPDKSSDSN